MKENSDEEYLKMILDIKKKRKATKFNREWKNIGKNMVFQSSVVLKLGKAKNTANHTIIVKKNRYKP